ncbi:MAG: hypothetical protein ACREWG_03580 [Gammaproteobacteria bacterium]
MKQRIFSLISIVLGIVFALALIEVTAIAWLYVEDGRYTPAAELFERTHNTYVRDATKKGTACRYVDTLYPHPYVAFVRNANPPCGIAWVNNVGLFGPDFPTVKPTERYVVMLIGGSVAAMLAQLDKPPAPRYLEEELNKKYISPNGKPWMVLHAADGSWKEPQLFIMFSLYASSVDAMISLGGFNEYYFFRPDTTERLEVPTSNFLEVNPFVADENFGDAAIGWALGHIAGTLALNPILGRSHAAYLIIRGIEAAAKGQDSFKSNKRTTIPNMFALPQDIRGNADRIFDLQLGLYQKYLRAEEVVAHDNGVKTAYFFQPAPAWGKTLTEEEKRVVGDLSYGELYRRIVTGMMTLREHGLPMYDLGDIFVNEKGSIYADQIHYLRYGREDESRGNRLMAARIGVLLAETWGLQRKP